MSKDLPQQPQQSEEVDLGQLFKMIGNMFDKLFAFIGKIFNKIYDILLIILIHFFKRLKWYLLVSLIGFVIGYFIDYKGQSFYRASMQLETNYGSARQVYENISYLNQLASIDRDSVELSKRLNIPVTDAASLLGFTIEPNIDENDKMKLFSDFRAQLDSLTKSTFSYNDYIDGLTAYSFKTHQIEVVSKDKFIFSKLNEGLLNQLAQNEYLLELRDVAIDNLSKEEKVLEVQRRTLDSLSNFYLGIRKIESEKNIENTAGKGTNFYLGQVQEKNLLVDETQLIERRLELDKDKLGLYLEAMDKKYIVNPISKFPAAGYTVKKFSEMAKVRIPLLLITIAIMIFLLLGIKNYLKQEEERLLNKKMTQNE